MATHSEAPVVQARASVRYLPVSATKIRPVLDLVRGLPAEDAERVLQLTPRAAARDIQKVLLAALANGEHNHQLPAEELYVARCWCDEGPTRGAGRARARGRYFRIRKRTSHLTVVLARLSDAELETRREKAEATGVGRAGSARRRAERVRASRRAARGEAAEPLDDDDHDHDDHDRGDLAPAPPAEGALAPDDASTGERDAAVDPSATADGPDAAADHESEQ